MNKVKVYYVFDKKIEYSCSTCGGLCCNLNANLRFSKKQIEEANFIWLRDYFYKVDNIYFLKTPKQCWFLKNKQCSLKKNKPLGCKLYPINLYKINNNIIVAEIIPCPSMYFNDKNLPKIHYENDIKEYIENFEISYYSKKHKLFIEEISDMEFLNKLQLINEYLEQIQVKDIFEMLIKQIFVHPIILKIIDITNFYSILNDFILIKNMLADYVSSNIQNQYILLNSYFYKYILFKYYTPLINKKINAKVSCVEDFYNMESYIIFNKIYNSDIKWSIK